MGGRKATMENIPEVRENDEDEQEVFELDALMHGNDGA